MGRNRATGRLKIRRIVHRVRGTRLRDINAELNPRRRKTHAAYSCTNYLIEARSMNNLPHGCTVIRNTAITAASRAEERNFPEIDVHTRKQNLLAD